MGRRKKGGHKKKTEESDYDSDDPRAYRKEKAPDPSSQDYYYDDVDEFHANREKIPLEGQLALEPAESSENEEEVLGWDDDDNDSDNDLKERLRKYRRDQKLEEMASDLEDDDEDDEDGDVDSKSWGKNKAIFYSTDYVDDDLPGVGGPEEEAEQEAEEMEALAIQTRMAEALQDEDFGLDLFKEAGKQFDKVTKDEGFEEEKVTKDLSKLSKREKLEILKKESPEFLELVGDFKIKMQELISRLQPLVSLVKRGVVTPGSDGALYIHTKYQLYLSYCMNICFYMILKAKHKPVKNHPVIGRILAFRKLINELQPADEKVEAEIQMLLEESSTKEDKKGEQQKEGEEEEGDDENKDSEKMPVAGAGDKKSAIKLKRIRKHTADADEEKSDKVSKKKVRESGLLSAEEMKALEYYKTVAAAQREKKGEIAEGMGEFDGDLEDENDDDEENEKRGITYQISKNRGLTPFKRKELRNPRVKHRLKYKKAKVRRKGQVREPRTELKRYSGEVSGIRAGVIKSVKIK